MSRSMFGWSYPPGAANDPYAPWNQTEALDITPYATPKPENTLLFWDEDGHLIATVWYDVVHGVPHDISLGEFDWDDAKTQEENCKAAACAAMDRLASST